MKAQRPVLVEPHVGAKAALNYDTGQGVPVDHCKNGRSAGPVSDPVGLETPPPGMGGLNDSLKAVPDSPENLFLRHLSSNTVGKRIP